MAVALSKAEQELVQRIQRAILTSHTDKKTVHGRSPIPQDHGHSPDHRIHGYSPIQRDHWSYTRRHGHLYCHGQSNSWTCDWRALEKALADEKLLPELVSIEWDVAQKRVSVKCSQNVESLPTRAVCNDPSEHDLPVPPVDTWMMQLTAQKSVPLPALADMLSATGSSIPAQDLHIVSKLAAALWLMQGSQTPAHMQISLPDQQTQPPYTLQCSGVNRITLFQLRMLATVEPFYLQNTHLSLDAQTLTVSCHGRGSTLSEAFASRLFECKPTVCDPDVLPQLKRHKMPDVEVQLVATGAAATTAG